MVSLKKVLNNIVRGQSEGCHLASGGHNFSLIITVKKINPSANSIATFRWITSV